MAPANEEKDKAAPGSLAQEIATALKKPAPPDPSKDKQIEVVALQEGIMVPGATVDGKTVTELPVGKVASVSRDVFTRAIAPHRGMVTTPQAFEARKKAEAAQAKAQADFDSAIEKIDSGDEKPATSEGAGPSSGGSGA